MTKKALTSNILGLDDNKTLKLTWHQKRNHQSCVNKAKYFCTLSL